MVHYSDASPDRKSALIVEMNGQGEWAMCRLIPLEGNIPTQVHRARGSMYLRRLVSRRQVDVFHRMG